MMEEEMERRGGGGGEEGGTDRVELSKIEAIGAFEDIGRALALVQKVLQYHLYSREKGTHK